MPAQINDLQHQQLLELGLSSNDLTALQTLQSLYLNLSVEFDQANAFQKLKQLPNLRALHLTAAYLPPETKKPEHLDFTYSLIQCPIQKFFSNNLSVLFAETSCLKYDLAQKFISFISPHLGYAICQQRKRCFA